MWKINSTPYSVKIHLNLSRSLAPQKTSALTIARLAVEQVRFLKIGVTSKELQVSTKLQATVFRIRIMSCKLRVKH